MFKPMTLAALLCLGPSAAVPPPAGPPAGGWAAPHLIFSPPVFVSLRLHCPGPPGAACVLTGPAGRWAPDRDDGSRVLREPFFLELAAQEPFLREHFTFALPLAEDRHAVRFDLADGMVFGVPPWPNDVQSFACLTLPAQRVGTVLAGARPSPWWTTRPACEADPREPRRAVPVSRGAPGRPTGPHPSTLSQEVRPTMRQFLAFLPLLTLALPPSWTVVVSGQPQRGRAVLVRGQLYLPVEALGGLGVSVTETGREVRLSPAGAGPSEPRPESNRASPGRPQSVGTAPTPGRGAGVLCPAPRR